MSIRIGQRAQRGSDRQHSFFGRGVLAFSSFPAFCLARAFSFFPAFSSARSLCFLRAAPSRSSRSLLRPFVPTQQAYSASPG